MDTVNDRQTSARRRVGPYELVRCVGQGGMAQVWLARRTAMAGADKPCALKLPLPHLASDERFRRMFLAEARLAMRLTHSNLVSTFDVGEDGDLLFMAMEWVDGLDLACFGERLREIGVTVPPSLAVHVAGEILDALAYAHAFSIGGQPQGIVHRDVSPHNVLLSASGEVLLTDFGIASMLHEDTSHEHAKGKLRYMAAEHLRGQATQRSDLFAVGAILHELLDGRRFRDEIVGQHLFGHILDGVVPELSRTDVPEEVERVRRGLLEPDERRRIGSAEEALAMLSAWPGYRNERAALRRLYRQHQQVQGTCGRASGLTELVPLSSIEPITTDRHTIPRAAEAAVSASPIATLPGVRPLLEATPPRRGGTWSDAPSTRTQVASPARAFWLAVVLASILPPLLGILYLRSAVVSVRAIAAPDLAQTRGRDPAPTAEPAPGPRIPSARDRVEAPTPIASAPQPTDAIAVAEPEVAPSEAVVAPSVASEERGPARRRDKVRASGPPVVVHVVLDFLDWAEVRVDGRRFAVDSRVQITLPAGAHRFEWRTSPAGPWRRAGVHELAAGREHRVHVRADELRVRAS